MPHRLMSLRDVPDEELVAIRELLDEHHIDYYETPANRWGISAAGLWLKDPQQKAAAKQLLESFQAEYTLQQQEAHQQRLANGNEPSFLSRLKQSPLEVIALMLAALFILWISTTPFLNFGS